jgi:hypothetical protein
MIIVDTIRQVKEPSSARLAEAGESTPAALVEATSGETALVDASSSPGRVWLQILTERQRDGDPVFLDVHDESKRLTRLLLPIVARVDRLVEGSESVEVALEISHAKHYLKRSHPNFPRLLDLLKLGLQTKKPLLVTEDDDRHEIVDVRDAGGLEPPKVEAAQPEPEVSGVVGGISLRRAGEIFDLVSAQTCAPRAPTNPCIPFLYPDDGCWGRAHEMARMVSAEGVAVRKVWLYGDLRVATKNSPACGVSWNYHVAPTLLVEDNNSSAVYVIDPSIFSAPVPQLDWKRIQGDPQAVSAATDSRTFYRSSNGDVIYDDNFSETAAVLRTYRQRLQLRSVGPSGPPSYACP